jgi:hypothetical protein
MTQGLRQHRQQMPYVRRDPQGSLLSLHRESEAGAIEFLTDDSPEVQAFVAQLDPQAFSQLDADFVRVLEDVIDVLIARHVINLTDLPAQAQSKLFARRSHRHSTSLSRLNLLGDETSTPGYSEPDGAALLR